MDENMNTLGQESVEDVGAAATGETAGAQSNGEGQTGQDDPEKKYTDSDVDRIVAKKIAAERKKMQKLFNDEQQESEIEIRERNVRKREMMADARDSLSGDGLPSALAELLDYSDQDAYQKSYESVTRIFREAVQQAAKIAFAGTSPRAGTGREHSADAIANAFAPSARY